MLVTAQETVSSVPASIRSGGEGGRARPVINKLLLRAFTKSDTKSSKNPKTFTLRDVPIYTTCEDLKEEIRAQLEGDVKHEFDVGYLEGSTQISIRTSHDLSEIWNNVCQGKKVVLWCDGLRELDSSSRREKRIR